MSAVGAWAVVVLVTLSVTGNLAALFFAVNWFRSFAALKSDPERALTDMLADVAVLRGQGFYVDHKGRVSRIQVYSHLPDGSVVPRSSMADEP